MYFWLLIEWESWYPSGFFSDKIMVNWLLGLSDFIQLYLFGLVLIIVSIVVALRGYNVGLVNGDAVSQFTLYGILKGNKPDFHVAMPPQKAKPFYDSLVDKFRKSYNPDAVKGKCAFQLHLILHSFSFLYKYHLFIISRMFFPCLNLG